MYNKTTRNTGAGVMYDRGESPRYNRNGIQVKNIKILKKFLSKKMACDLRIPLSFNSGNYETLEK